MADTQLAGVTRLEESSDERYGTRDDYGSYKKSVSVLIPLPPPLYRRLGRVAKWFCCEWGIYEFREFDETGRPRATSKTKLTPTPAANKKDESARSEDVKLDSV